MPGQDDCLLRGNPVYSAVDNKEDEVLQHEPQPYESLAGVNGDYHQSPAVYLKEKPLASNHATSPSNQRMPSFRNPVANLDPRPIEQLHNERSYLLYNLQRQGERATKLFSKYAALETRLSSETLGKGRESRKAKKEAALLKSKISENTQQEQLILLRLGELYVEMQNRERWALVHQYHQQTQAHRPVVPLVPNMLFPPFVEAGSLFAYPAAPSSSLESSMEHGSLNTSSVLSPLSPTFVPRGGGDGGGGVAFSEDIWGLLTPTQPPPPPAPSATEQSTLSKDTRHSFSVLSSSESTSVTIPEDVEVQEQQQQHKGEVGVKFNEEPVDVRVGEAEEITGAIWGFEGGEEEEFEDDEDTDNDPGFNAWKNHLRRSICITKPPYSYKAADKRMSLPSLKTIWPHRYERATATV
ncbi:hypothetical protein B0T17DRAFT_618026 [Bombardia bombarda]|uniref:Uncharacterized protein n=1 Tax=Bombardia bombarda TaxID=252184 RepID=A0AA39WU05_9PEZI|nr:hypothetical protein B0T17DRAFT_618026 [Bombardia bombarda]